MLWGLLGWWGCATQAFICNDSDASVCWSFDADVSQALMSEECVSGAIGEAGVEGEDIQCTSDAAVGSCAVPGDEPRTFTYYSSGGQPYDAESAEADCADRGGEFAPAAG